MSADDTPKGAPYFISYKELVAINDRMAKIDSKLDVALTLPADVKALEVRVYQLETERAVLNAEGRQRGKVVDYIWGVGVAIIATGVWLPLIKSALGIIK